MKTMTRKQFLAALRRAGWVRRTAHTYRSPNGTVFQPDRYTSEKGVLWRWYARQDKLPDEIPGEGWREIN